MTEDEIADVVIEIMLRDGPDGHIDGHDVITSFVMAVLSGRGAEWYASYLKIGRKALNENPQG